jgi:hypothetical protein
VSEYRGDVELLTPNTIPHARNQDYLRAVSALGDGNRIRDTVFQHAHELSREKFSSWPLTAKFQARVINLCSKRYVRLELAKEIEYAREAKVSGEAIVRDRRIVLNAREATNLTPLFLLSIIHVRDLLTMPAHADLKPFCIRALKAFGYRNEGMFIKKDFFESEGSLAAEVAERTLRKFSEASGASGISGWVQDVKAHFACRLNTESSPERIVTWLSACLLCDAPYWSRPDFHRSFT